MDSNLNSWSEEDSRIYHQLATAAVPEREEQIATLLSLLPFAIDQGFGAVELGCGEGFLSQALLEAFPASSVLSLDGSEEMRAMTANRLSPHSGRFEVAAFELGSQSWWPRLDGADAVISSLCLHHLPNTAKQQLYRGIFETLKPGGAFLVIDLLEPSHSRARELLADQWDAATRRRSIDLTGTEALYERFLAEKWNHYRYPDSVDLPSPLPDHLKWLREAGFESADAFSVSAGHAVFGGFKRSTREIPQPRLTLDLAHRAVDRAFSRAGSC
ncbi:MAG: class I SAM-dependent methyltransferase [Deltaproteobacteria bacterium]|nr:class I SAM-dependent methyltransferase [Deltaproteobacteria bacterium]